MFKRLSLFTLIVFAALIFSKSSYAIETLAKQAILIDTTTDTVLYEKNADELMHPSSMSKLMTAYMLFDKLKDGSVKLDSKFMVSENAWRKQGSKTFVTLGSEVAVEDLLRGIIIQSGNDACIVVAEGIAGSEEEFAKRMNAKAKEIGLKNSNFMNATGWPDENHKVTARDLATLAKRIIDDFPEYYHYYSELEFTFHGITQQNRNLLLRRSIGVDGLKTGHTEIAGYGITVSAKQGDRRLVLVVNGLSSEKERAEEAEKLIRYGFREYESRTIFKAGDIVTEAPVWMGQAETVKLTVDKDMTITLPISERGKIKFVAKFNSPIKAPIATGDVVGEINITLPEGGVITKPLKAAESVEKLSFFARIIANIKHRLLG